MALFIDITGIHYLHGRPSPGEGGKSLRLRLRVCFSIGELTYTAIVIPVHMHIVLLLQEGSANGKRPAQFIANNGPEARALHELLVTHNKRNEDA